MTAQDRLDDAVVVLTGGTSGIGASAARELADRGATVGVVGRDRVRGEEMVDAGADTPGEIRFHRFDLASGAAVRDLAAEVRDTYDRLDVLAHNAGLSAQRRRETPDGIERTLAVNHLAPYLLTHELVDSLRASAPSRVVVTASAVHRQGTLDFENLQFERDYDTLDAYARSKLANVAFTVELAARLSERDGEGDDGDRDEERVTANSFHPGFVPETALFRDAKPWVRAVMWVLGVVPWVGTTPEEGARRLVTVASDPAFGERTGRYLADDGVEAPASAATDPEVRERLWDVSADLVGVDPNWP